MTSVDISLTIFKVSFSKKKKKKLYLRYDKENQEN